MNVYYRNINRVPRFRWSITAGNYWINRGGHMRRKDDEKEKSIKEAVIKLILQEGFHGTSISKIAKMAGVSPATVYIYFENKEIMLQDIYREYSEEIFNYLLNRVHQGMEGQATYRNTCEKLL